MVIRNEERRRRVIREEIEEFLDSGGNPQAMLRSTKDAIDDYKKELKEIQSMKITQTMWHHIADLELMVEILQADYMDTEVK
ncbi:MAG: hypothetical protein ACOX6S_00185 [Clostridia bacterium]